MAEELPAWRKKLAVLIDLPAEKKRVADILAVSDWTLIRWSKGIGGDPRPGFLRRLPDAFPEPDRSELKRLISEEYSQIFPAPTPPVPKQRPQDYLSVSEDLPPQEPAKEIPAPFYARILAARRTHHFSILHAFDLGMLQIASHLDPARRGIQVHLFALSPSRRTLYEIMRATYHDLRSIHLWFLGQESLPGEAIRGDENIALDKTRKQIVALIKYEKCIAGCLLVNCPHEDQVSLTRAELALQYADLFAVEGFREADFVEPRSISLTTVRYTQEQQYALFQKAMPSLLFREKTPESVQKMEALLLSEKDSID